MSKYLVEQVEGGWQIFYQPGENEHAKYPEAGGKIYPSRQNAYTRRKQLQERLEAQERYIYTIYVKIVVENRESARQIVRYLNDLVWCRVIDPLLDSDIRFITCALRCRADESVHDPSVPPWRAQAPTEREFHAFLEPIKTMSGFVRMETGKTDETLL